MTAPKIPLQKLPQVVKLALISHRGWLCGSAASWALEGGAGGAPRDFDVFVPPFEWQPLTRAVRGLVSGIQINEFGGLALETPEGAKVDLWPMHLEDYLTAHGDYMRQRGIRSGVVFRLQPFVVVEIS